MVVTESAMGTGDGIMGGGSSVSRSVLVFEIAVDTEGDVTAGEIRSEPGVVTA